MGIPTIERLHLGELKNAISKRMDFRKIILLKGNPMLTSKKYADALNSLKVNAQ